MSHSEKIRNYVEELMLGLEQMGVPRTASRVLAYLLVCEVSEQSIQDLAVALQLSKSSVSMALQTLSQYQLIERVSLPGKRPDFYRIGSGMWQNLISSRVVQMTGLRLLAEDGLVLLEDAPDDQKNRLKEMHSIFRFMEKELPDLLNRWELEK
jgi:DNA-binding transcriptional regulator GbsR (MarR family)